MAKQAGKDMVIKKGNADGPPETFTTIASGRGATLGYQENPIDVTDKDSTNEYIERIRGGTREFEASFEGVFADDATQEAVRANAMATDQSILNYQVDVPGEGVYEGAFIITEMEKTGEYEDAVMFSFTLQSAGVIAFTAAS